MTWNAGRRNPYHAAFAFKGRLAKRLTFLGQFLWVLLQTLRGKPPLLHDAVRTQQAVLQRSKEVLT